MIENMIVSFEPNIPQICFRKEIREGALAHIYGQNPGGPNLFKKIWKRVKVEIKHKKAQMRLAKSQCNRRWSTIFEF